MSNYTFKAKRKTDENVVNVLAIDDCFGNHKYGYRLEGETTVYHEGDFYDLFEKVDQPPTEAIASAEVVSERDILFLCSRCGGKYLPLGKVLKWGKHYPAFTTKDTDGKTIEHKEDTEIKEALCRECAKEHFDNEKIKELATRDAHIKAEAVALERAKIYADLKEMMGAHVLFSSDVDEYFKDK